MHTYIHLYIATLCQNFSVMCVCRFDLFGFRRCFILIFTFQQLSCDEERSRDYRKANQRGAVVEWLEQLGYGAESRRIA